MKALLPSCFRVQTLVQYENMEKIMVLTNFFVLFSFLEVVSIEAKSNIDVTMFE